MDSEYPILSIKEKQKEEIEPPPAYVMEGKIIKLLKKNKKMELEEISSQLKIEA